MTRFRRLTWAEARGLTRAELLDRIEAEQAYWHRKRARTDADVAAERTFREIMHATIEPTISGGLDALRGLLEGRPSTFLDEKPLAGFKAEGSRP